MVTDPWLSCRFSSHGLPLAGLASAAASFGGSAKAAGMAAAHSRAAASDQRKEDLVNEIIGSPGL